MAFEKITQTTRRAGQVARIATAARAAAKAGEGDREAAQRALAALMADARGVPLKVGQLMGTLGKGEAYLDLARGIDPQPLSVIRPAVERALAAPLESVFTEFGETGIAASLGQVHKARLHNGESVAVKVRYPDIAGAVDAELRLAQLVPGMGPVRKWGFDLEGYKRVLHDNMHEELDYRGEMDRQEQFRTQMAVTGLVVPRVYPEFCSESLLVQSWEDGAALDEIGHWPEEQRRHVAVILMCTMFQSLFVHGTLHGDPHLGNYRFRPGPGATPEVVLLDYGCMVPIPEVARLALLKLILGVIDEDETDPLQCFHAMGFAADKLQPIQSVLPALSQVLMEPFTVPYAFSIENWNLRARVDALLGDLKWWFRAAGPPNLLLLMRAFHGLATQLETLQVNLPWQSVFFRIVDATTRDVVRRAPLPALPAGLSEKALNFRDMARYLKVQVVENGRQTTAVTLPASQVTVLETLIPEDILGKLQAGDIDLAAIKARACASGIVPQPLFEHSDGAKTHRVWLE